MNQTDAVYIREIANALNCHRAFIVATIVRLQKDLMDAQAKIKLAQEALK